MNFPNGASVSESEHTPYRGRLAPSPTGHLHLGHVQTFWIASQRAILAEGELLLRCDDLDFARCREEFVTGFVEDLEWLNIRWLPPMVRQRDRIALYRHALEHLHAGGYIYPCDRSRRDVLNAAGAPHEGPGGEDDEPIYPPAFRPDPAAPLTPLGDSIRQNWRFRVPDGAQLTFEDGNLGRQCATAGRDFGDFVVWRKDGLPSYQLASVVDDALLGITEVVRGADLVRSTFRQLLLFKALNRCEPRFFHCPLVLDDQGNRLAKRHEALSLRTLRSAGATREELLARFDAALRR